MCVHVACKKMGTAYFRRVSYQLAVEPLAQVHAVLSAKAEGGYVVSVRAPKTHRLVPMKCAASCHGGERRGAAGLIIFPKTNWIVL